MNKRDIVKRVTALLLALCLLGGCAPKSEAPGMPPIAASAKTQAQSFAISDENPAAETDEGVRIDFGSFNELGESNVRIEPAGVEEDGLGATLTSYDFTVQGRSEFDGLITISIPYDPEKTIPGEEENSLLAQYWDEAEGEWVLVDYTVDTENKLIHITTDHLSKYCTVTISDKGTPYARIANVGNLQFMDDGTAGAVFEEYTQLGRPGPLALEQGLEIANSYLGLGDNVLTLATLGGTDTGSMGAALANTPLLDTIGNISRKAGLGLAIAQLAYDLYKGDPQQTAVNAYKNTITNAVAFYGSSALQLSMIGVMAIDYSLNEFGKAAWQSHEDVIYSAVKYYNDVESPRSLDEWYRLFAELYNRYGNDPARMKRGIDSLMYSFSVRFFNLTSEQQSEMAGYAGLARLPYIYENDRYGCTDRYMAALGAKLQPVFARLKQKAMMQVKQEYYAQLHALQRELNKTVTLRVVEEIPENDESQYAGQTASILLSSGASPGKEWVLILDDAGRASMEISLLGYLQAGAPSTVEVAALTDGATLRVPFVLVAPETVVTLSQRFPISSITYSHGKTENAPDYFRGIFAALGSIGPIPVEPDGSFSVSGKSGWTSINTPHAHGGQSSTTLDCRGLTFKGKLNRDLSGGTFTLSCKVHTTDTATTYSGPETRFESSGRGTYTISYSGNISMEGGNGMEFREQIGGSYSGSYNSVAYFLVRGKWDGPKLPIKENKSGEALAGIITFHFTYEQP